MRNNDVSATVSLYWSRPFNPYTTTTLNTVQEGSSILLGVYGRATGQPLLVTLAVTEVGSYLDPDGEGAWGYEHLGNGKLRVTVPEGSSFQNVFIPLLENDAREADGTVTITVEPDPGMSYVPTVGLGAITVPVKDNDTPSTVSISGTDVLTEGAQLSYTLKRTWEPGQSRGELSVNVKLAQTGDYISWPEGNEPGDDGLVTIPVTFAARSLTATLTLETVDDEASEVHARLPPPSLPMPAAATWRVRAALSPPHCSTMILRLSLSQQSPPESPKGPTSSSASVGWATPASPPASACGWAVYRRS